MRLQSFSPVILVWMFLAVPTLGLARAFGVQGQNNNDNDIDAWTVQHFRLASEAQRQNNLGVAEKEYQLILSRRPKFAEVHQNLGIVYHQQRKYRKAVKTLQVAVSLKPDLLGAQVFLGIDRYMIQEFKSAVGSLEKALRLNPEERQAGLYLAFTYLALESPEKAARQLRKTAQYFPEDVEIAYHLGEAYLEGVRQRMVSLQQAGERSALRHWALAISSEQKGDRDGTILEYLRALAIEPKNVELYWRLAIALRKAGMADLSGAALQRYALLNPDRDLESLGLDAIASEPSGDQAAIAAHKDSYERLWESLPYRGAAEKIKGRITGQPQDWPLAFLQARSYFLASDYDAAEQVVEGPLRNYFHLPSVALLRLEIESQLALRYFGLVVAKEPNSDRAKLLLAKSYGATGRTKDAISTYQEILEQAPDRLGIHLAIGQLYEDEQKWPAAIEELKAELALAPDNALALAHLGHAYEESQDADQAIQVLTKLLETHPEDGRAYADLGRAWAMKQNPAKAIEAFERALLYDSNQHNLHYRLFQLYSKMGDNLKAKTHLAAFKAGEIDKQKKLRAATADLLKQ